MTIEEIKKHYQDNTMTTREVVDGYLERIANDDANIGAFIEVFEADARLKADEIDKKRQDNQPLGQLAGIPIAIKDNILIEGKTCQAGSLILENYKASYNATVIERLLKEDAIIIGRTNMDEFACGSSTESSAFGVTKNPADQERVPGGSSGGSAAAVAAGFVPVALGTDTGGSIRQPASLCGVLAIKPTYGSVSRFGAIALASSFDQIGPIATTARDLATVLQIIGGQDDKDATSKTVDISMPDLSSDNIKGLKIGVPKQFFSQNIDPAIEQSVKEAINKFKEAGAEIIDIDLPELTTVLAIYYVIMPAELSSNMHRYDALQYGSQVIKDTVEEQVKATRSQKIGEEVKRRILLGTFVLSTGYKDAYYKKAVEARQDLKTAVEKALEQVDVLMGPTSPVTAWKFGEKSSDPLAMYMADIYTVTANLAEIPAISIPVSEVDSLPVGLQIMAKQNEDAKILDLAHWYESN